MQLFWQTWGDRRRKSRKFSGKNHWTINSAQSAKRVHDRLLELVRTEAPFEGCFTSSITLRLISDGEPRRTTTSTFTQLLSSTLQRCFKPVLNWANVCSPNILGTVRRAMIRFLIELLVRRTWFGQFDELYFVLNWMRCKLRLELAADAQQTAWSKM